MVLCNLSTPRFQHHHNQGHPTPRPDGNYIIPPAEPIYNTRSSQAPFSTGSTVDITQLFVMHLDKNRQQAKLIEYRKDLLANVSTYDGKDKKACLMWITQCEHTARNAKMALRELIVAKARLIVSTKVQNFLIRVPENTDTQIKQHILECFSNVGTRTEALHYLKKMTLDEDKSLLAHNTEYAAVHEAAHRISPENQMSEIALMDYVRTLPQITCDELTKQITRGDSKIHNLRQAMNMAENLDRQARQREIKTGEECSLRNYHQRRSCEQDVNTRTGQFHGREK